MSYCDGTCQYLNETGHKCEKCGRKIAMIKICESCKWYYKGCCVNGESKNCTEMVFKDMSCDKWELIETEYWKREAIKNVAELGEIKIKQKPMKPKDVRGMRNFLNEIYMYRGFCQCGHELTSEFFYCSKCGQKIDWSVD